MSEQDLASRNESPGNDMSEKRKRKTCRVLSQVLASTAKNIILFAVGLLAGFPTIVIPTVHNAPPNATLTLNDEEVSWYGSINYIAIPIGCLVSGLINNAFGRKRSMQALALPLLATWIIYYFANSSMLLLAAAVLNGLAEGLLQAAVLTYTSEICEPNLRGILSATAPLSTILGVSIQYSLGSWINWRTLAGLSALVPILGFIAMFFVPESPPWLISKNRLEDAEKALCWLRGWTTKEHVHDEYDELVSQINSGLKTTEQVDRSVNDKTNRIHRFNIKDYMKRTFLIPFLLMFYSSAVVFFTGTSTLAMYAVNIFNSFGAPINGYTATAILGLSKFLGPLTNMVLIRYTGKRPLVITSVLGLGLLFGGAGLYGYLYLGLEKLDNGAHVEEKFQGNPAFSWVPTACFIAVPFTAFLGVHIILWLLIGEVYPPEIRGVASGISAGLCYLMGFIVNKMFFNLIAAFTLPGVFIMYSVIAFVSLAVFYFWLPETEGWSLAEVQEHFAGKRNLIKAGRNKTNN